MRLDRANDPKTITSFYKPKERIEARERSDWTILACVAVIVLVGIVRGF